MKICLINNLYKPYVRGGAEVVVEAIEDGLRNAGHQVFIITTKPLFNKFKIQNSKFKILYINSIYFNLNKIPKIFRLPWHFVDMFDVGSYFAVKRILKKEKPDVVMTHNLKGVGFLVPIAIRSLKIKHIHTLHDIQLLHPSGLMFYGEEKLVTGVFSKFYQLICRRLFGSPDAIVSPSKWLLGEHIGRRFFKDSKNEVLPNPMVNRQQTMDNRQQGCFKFLYVGQIEKHKGILFLIKAFCHFERSEKSLKGGSKPELLIVGDGSKLKQAQELIGENKNIKLLGRMKNHEVMELMRSASCLIMPSFCYENSPTVIYEAMSASLPVIASRIGGVPELVDDNNLLFEPKNEEDLINRMKWAVEYKEGMRIMGERKDFGVESYVKKLIELL